MGYFLKKCPLCGQLRIIQIMIYDNLWRCGYCNAEFVEKWGKLVEYKSS